MPHDLSQFARCLVHEFVEDYVDGLMSRRDLMCRVLHITSSVALPRPELSPRFHEPACFRAA